jgi:hypothetical protein
MIRIKCANTQCVKSFPWDETSELKKPGELARPREKGSVRVIAVCPHCSTENAVWVKRRVVKVAHIVRRREWL